jgi:signal transduction histidine kinase
MRAETKCLEMANRQRMVDKLRKINEALLNLGADHRWNVNLLTGLCGELLGATCALYNHLSEGMLCAKGRWHTPADFKAEDQAEGHICYDVIQRSTDEVFVVRNLQGSKYAKTDPNVAAYGLQTYFGKAVRCDGEHVGSLCAVFTEDVELTEDNEQILNIIAAALGSEENRKMAEVRQAELLEKINSINKELQSFAYVVSHDLKAPLRGISTLAEWLVADCADKLGAEGKEQLELLNKKVMRMHSLIDGVLQYSRIERTREELVKVDLNELVPEIVEAIASPPHISITIEGQLPVIETELTRITQVFQNLLSNAVKYMDKPKGEIKVGCTDANDFWKFSISDNGPGIEERHFERIFQIFQTLNRSDDFESTGIGLTIVKKIVEMHGGKIWLESTPSKGTTFFFTAPKDNKKWITEQVSFTANGVSENGSVNPKHS